MRFNRISWTIAFKNGKSEIKISLQSFFILSSEKTIELALKTLDSAVPLILRLMNRVRSISDFKLLGTSIPSD